MADVGRLLRDARLNALVAWALLLVMAATVGVAILTGNLVWSGFAAVVVLVALLPPLARRSPRVMLPWEVLLFAGLPILGRSVLPVPQFGLATTYLSVAALGLLVAVELHLFTAVKMSPGFAVLFVTVTTIAVAGVWGVVRTLYFELYVVLLFGVCVVSDRRCRLDCVAPLVRSFLNVEVGYLCVVSPPFRVYVVRHPVVRFRRGIAVGYQRRHIEQRLLPDVWL